MSTALYFPPSSTLMPAMDAGGFDGWHSRYYCIFAKNRRDIVRRPQIERGAQCVLEEDTELAETLELKPNTTLNCLGHVLTSNRPRNYRRRKYSIDAGSRYLSASGAGRHDTELRNSQGFDFGVLSIDSKLPAGIKKNPGAIAGIRNRVRQN